MYVALVLAVVCEGVASCAEVIKKTLDFVFTIRWELNSPCQKSRSIQKTFLP
jgi:hypothetical protein